MPLRTGDVVRAFCVSTRPPKVKRFVVVALDGRQLVLLINSDLSEFVQNREQLMDAQVSVRSTEYTFIEHDSWIDCGDPHYFQPGELDRIVARNPQALIGRISAQIAQEISERVARSWVLNAQEQARITDAFENYAE